MKKGNIQERFFVIEEIGRRVGRRYLARMMDVENFNGIRRHELMHSWIDSINGLDSLSTVYIIFLKKTTLMFSGICIPIGTLSLLRSIVHFIAQAMFEFFSYIVHQNADPLGLLYLLNAGRKIRRTSKARNLDEAKTFSFTEIFSRVKEFQNDWNVVSKNFRLFSFIMRHEESS